MLEKNTKEQAEMLEESRMKTRRGDRFKKGVDNLLNVSERSIGIRTNKYSLVLATWRSWKEQFHIGGFFSFTN